jgi:hypothetical protein
MTKAPLENAKKNTQVMESCRSVNLAGLAQLTRITLGMWGFGACSSQTSWAKSLLTYLAAGFAQALHFG